MYRTPISMMMAALMNRGVMAPKMQIDYSAPVMSGRNKGFKRNRRAELKRSARRAAR